MKVSLKLTGQFLTDKHWANLLLTYSSQVSVKDSKVKFLQSKQVSFCL